MLTLEEKEELENLKKDPYMKLAAKSLRKPIDPDKKRLYQYRWLKNKGKKMIEEIESELSDED